VRDFSDFFCNSYDLEKITKVAIIDPLYAQKSGKNPDMFKEDRKFAKLLVFFRTDSVFCCFEHSFEPQSDSF
jgi:hypothetical protein